MFEYARMRALNSTFHAPQLAIGRASKLRHLLLRDQKRRFREQQINWMDIN